MLSSKVFSKISIFDRLFAPLIAFGTKKAFLLMEYSLLAIWGAFASHKNPPLITDSPICHSVFWQQPNLVKLEPRYSGLILETHMAAEYHVRLQHGWVGNIMWDILNTGRYFLSYFWVMVNILKKLTLRDCEYGNPVNWVTIITCVCVTESAEF